MPVDADLTARVSAIFSEVLHVEVASTETDLFEAGLLDSLAFVELLLQLERVFGVTTSLEDLELDHFRTIARIAALVSSSVTLRPRVVGIRASA